MISPLCPGLSIANVGNARAVAVAAKPTAEDLRNSRLVFTIDIAFSSFLWNNMPTHSS
jgi:hypothetical protein